MENFCHTPKYPVQTLSKALEVITYLKNNSSADGTTIISISKALNMGKSGVHRILDTLMAYNYVEKAGPTSSSYRLSWGLFGAGNAVPKQHTLNNINYSAILEKLCARFNETVNLGVISGRETTIICKIEPEIKLRTNTQLGEREPLHATAVGKLFLCDFSDEQLKAYFENISIQNSTESTIVSFSSMKNELSIIRKNDFALDNEEYVDGMICFAMPIRDFNGKIVSGISISGPSKRMTNEKLKDIEHVLKQACNEISYFLGYSSIL